MPPTTKQGAPSVRRQDLRAGQPGQRAAKRDAHDRQGDRKRPMPDGRMLGGERRGIRHRAAQAEACEESKHGEHRHAAGR